MPVFRSGRGLAPDWCELEYFEIVELPVGSRHEFERVSRKEKLIVVKGGCRIAFGGGEIDASERTNLELDISDGHFSVPQVSSDSTLVRMCGHWGEETGGSGIFTVGTADGRQDKGDPVTSRYALDQTAETAGLQGTLLLLAAIRGHANAITRLQARAGRLAVPLQAREDLQAVTRESVAFAQRKKGRNQDSGGCSSRYSNDLIGLGR